MVATVPNGRLPALINSAFSLLSRCKSIDHFKQIHSFLITNGWGGDTFAMAKILQACSLSAFPDLGYASSILEQTRPCNTSSWNTIMREFIISSRPEYSLFCFSKMRQMGVNPDKHTYPLLLKAFSRCQRGNPGHIHAQAVKFGLDFDPFVVNSLISAYANDGELESAKRVFCGIEASDSVGWTSMINGCVSNDRVEEGVEMFSRMRSTGVEIDEVTVVAVLSAVGLLGDVWMGRCVHGFYIECGRVKWDVYVGSALVDMYAKCEHCNDAQKVFDKMTQWNVVGWSALIEGYVKCNRPKEAMLVFHDMLSKEVKPNAATLVSVLSASSELGALEQGRLVHAYAGKNNLEMNSLLGTSLIGMYAKCGSIGDAYKVFLALPNKDVYPWTAMISGFAMHGHADKALELFSSMVNSGVQPNAVTFIGVLCACSHGGLVDQGRSYFGSLSRVYGIEPKSEHYGCMVDLLGRSGYLEEALNLIKGMPMEPEPCIWGALFSACMIHKNFEMGRLIGEHLIKLQPFRSGRYALLANIYSMSQNWEEVAHVRKLMKGKAVEKTAGCSWIEINGAIHEFIAFDVSHFQCKDIYALLDRISGEVQNMEFVPS